MDLFLHPWFAAVGAALVSVPIIIHLINRMRFKRIRWAAMEFLLKSQKRNRRRLIIEQLLLLLLRCSLVLLAALLVARFLGFSALGFFQPQNTTHVIVLDDTLSMADRWKEQGEAKNSFEVAKGLIREIARSASRAGSAQQLKVVRLSDLSDVPFDQRINDETLRQLADKLEEMKGTYLHIPPIEGIKAAEQLFSEGYQDQRILHFVSDFRSRDWSGQEGDEVQKGLDRLAASGVKIFVVDCGHPVRGDKQVTLYHDNLAVVDLRPETRVAAEGMPVQFTVTIANFSNIERKNVFLSIKVEGEERLEASVPVQSIPPGLTKQTFMVGFVKLGFNQITASIEDEEAGLLEDNKRFAVIEVRKQVPVLVIDGDPTTGQKPGGDTYHLQTVFTAAKGYQVVARGVDELEKPTLDQYPCIYICNVEKFKSDKGLKNLEEYVQNGGSVAFFMGDKVKPDYFNAKLYRKGQGIFPAPLADKPTEPPNERERLAKLFNEQQKIYLRTERFTKADEMPIFGPVSDPKYVGHFQFLMIDRYLPVPRRQWNPEPGKVEELVTLPNEQPVTNYAKSAQELLDALPLKDAKYEKYWPGLEEHQRRIRTALTSNYLYELANALRALLTDAGDPKDPKKPNLTEFWKEPDSKIQQLRAEIDKLREVAQYGDPLVISGKFGKGRVVAFLTTAGKAWTDWPGGSPASVTYPVVMLELHKYLTSAGAESDLTVGSALDLKVDGTRYENKLHRYFQPDLANLGGAKLPDEKGDAPKRPGSMQDRGEQQGSTSGNALTFTFKDAREPGVYLFDLYPKPTEQNVEAKPEQRAYAFNVDANLEGDLKRAARDDLERTPTGGTPIIWAYAGSPPVVDQRRSDFSESPWLYLIFLLVLVVEQALAVHLSFHLRGGEAQLPAQATRPQATAA